MNQEQAKAWLPLIQAVAEGKTLQKARFTFTQDSQGKDIYKWSDDFYELKELLNLNHEFIRIKPEPKKQQYRICLIHYKTGKYGIGVSQTNDEEDEVQSHDEFVCWLTDRVEYELPEEKV